MTTSVPPPDDEIVSAQLDGMATPAEEAAIEASDAARIRRAELAAVRVRVGEPIIPPPGARDTAVAAALAVFDQAVSVGAPSPPDIEAITGGSDGSGGHPTGGPPSLAGRRARRRAVLVPVLGAAAAIVVVAMIATLGLSRSTTSTNLASEAPDARVEVGSTVAGGTGDEAPTAADPGAATAVAPPEGRATDQPDPPVIDFGPIADEASLARAVDRAVGQPPENLGAAPPTVAGSTDPRLCEARRRADDPALGAVVAVGVARYGGDPVGVLVFRLAENPGTGSAPEIRAYVSDPSSCSSLLVTDR